MNGNDDKLKALLRQWQDIEPRAGFEVSVWRRIRANRADRTDRVTLIEVIGRWLWRPATAVAVTIVASVIIGSSAGALSGRRAASIMPGELQFLGSGTLAGGYVRASSGGRQ